MKLTFFSIKIIFIIKTTFLTIIPHKYRRYADILVHRVLNTALNYEDMPKRTPEEVQSCASVCNAQKQSAKLAGDDSSNLYFLHFIQSLQSKPMPAAVIGIYDYNLEVVLIDTGHAIKIYYKVRLCL